MTHTLANGLKVYVVKIQEGVCKRCNTTRDTRANLCFPCTTPDERRFILDEMEAADLILDATRASPKETARKLEELAARANNAQPLERYNS